MIEKKQVYFPQSFYDILMRVVIIKENFSGCEVTPDSRLGIWTVFNAARLRTHLALACLPLMQIEILAIAGIDNK
jgi:hypothetical protein